MDLMQPHLRRAGMSHAMMLFTGRKKNPSYSALATAGSRRSNYGQRAEKQIRSSRTHVASI